MNVREYVKDILDSHHRYLRRELPELQDHLENASMRHAEDRSWQRLLQSFMELKRDLEEHIEKEEEKVFPALEYLEKCSAGGERFDEYKYNIREFLEDLQSEHDRTTVYLADLDVAMRKVEESGEEKALLEKLVRLRDNTHEHIRKEEDGLFPQSLQIYEKLIEGIV